MINYNYESYFAAIGRTGAGKSSLMNALSKTNLCTVSGKSKSCTQENKLISFIYNNHKFCAVDTPGLDDSDDDNQKINFIKKLLTEQPKIKKLLIIKPYNEFRMSKSLQQSLIIFMEAFPLTNFWEHVIVVNTFTPLDEIDDIKMENEKFVYKIIECNNLMKKIKELGIHEPTDIKEYFVDCKRNVNATIFQNEFNKIKDDIKNSPLMFKNVIEVQKERSRESTKNKGFYIVTKYLDITYIDFHDVKTKGEAILEEKEVAPANCEEIKGKEKEIQEEDGSDDVRWYDVASLGLTWMIRDTKRYKVYKIKVYKVGDKEVEGEKTFDRVIYK
jgi:hypothetical protein